ncbi:PAS domain-containing sensor histidine kinase [Arcobacter sp. FWKO B]|uniref:sensor histidine kinase n=1 Tax=Arcobacter sp. FWKO B TaxID=2593672 RepID=UPI0018A58D13|nr:PAS domain-containing sensor histidine kinase [Arcobacter sp. FWKO B]QOG12972.1 PAS domain S-box protein [Arcobacter sp. FWKO B]
MLTIIKENVELIVNGKDEILKSWIHDNDVLKVLKAHHINQDFFIKNYALEILEYYIDVIVGKKDIGDCPIISKLISYLKGKHIKVDELFLLCNGFRKSIVSYLYDINVSDKKIFDSVEYIFDHNFMGVLKKYSQNIDDVEIKLDKSLGIVDKYIIMSSTDVKGMIVYASEAFCTISGYTKKELLGSPHNIVRHPDMPQSLFENMWKTIQNGNIWHGEIKNRKKDGGYYWVDATIEPRFDSNGKIIGYDAIRQDITSKKLVQEQQSVLIEQSKSAAMGEMISMIAHQWRQPLQAVSILIQKLSVTKMIEGDITDELLEQVVDDVAKQLDYMSKTIDDFRDFFRPDKHKEFIRVSQLVDRARDFLQYMMKTDSINFKVESSEDINISLHINEVIQVLINIIKNARDAIIINKVQNGQIIVRYYTSGNMCIIEIEDNAGGIPENIKTKIFEPYFSTKTNKNGTGLGLYMCKTIIEQHSSGRIFVENVNGGAMFKIELPLSIGR